LQTTFLGVLSKRIDTHRMPMRGTVHINGKPYDETFLKSMSGYVMQDDLIHSYLTVHETLMYTAELRMPRSANKNDRSQREKEVLQLMGIEYCSNVIIGDSRRKGISGGERKRVCVAMELMMRPKLLFLDEPTSGLDSNTALSLCAKLKGLASSGECTVVCTIHQPQAKIFNLLDNLILMKRGNIIYQGAASKAADFFEICGYPCPVHENPADHIMDVICRNGKSQEQEFPAIKRLYDLDFGVDKMPFSAREIPLWISQFWTLMRRNMREKLLRWDIIFLNFLVTCIVSIFIGSGAWYQIGTFQASIPKRNAILFFCVIHQGVVASLQGTYSFPLERAIMLRERQSGAYYMGAYYCAKFMTDMLFQIPMPIVFTCIVYPMTQLAIHPAEKFFIFMAFNILCSMACTSLANMTSCIFVSIEMSTVSLAMFMEVTRLYSGFFISPLLLISTPLYYRFKFADCLSYMKYAYVGLCLNEYRDLKLHCSSAEVSAKLCKVTSGNSISAQYGYDQYSRSFCIGMLVVYILITRYIGYLGLRYIKV